MSDDRPVAVGLLTQRDLRVLGLNFTRHFPITDDGMFNDLLEQLNYVAPLCVAKDVDPQTS